MRAQSSSAVIAALTVSMALLPLVAQPVSAETTLNQSAEPTYTRYAFESTVTKTTQSKVSRLKTVSSSTTATKPAAMHAISIPVQKFAGSRLGTTEVQSFSGGSRFEPGSTSGANVSYVSGERLSLKPLVASSFRVINAEQMTSIRVPRAYCAVNQPSTIPSSLIAADSDVSKTFLSEINRGLGKIPVAILHELARSGYRVVVSESLANAVPAAAHQQVRGYTPHSTWDTVYGMFNRTTKRVVMAETALQPDAMGNMAMIPLRDTQRREGIIRHETGHAVDQYLGNFSHTADFAAAYDKAVSNIHSAHAQKVLAYYLQGGDAGHEETFAEIFASLDEDACDRHSDTLLREYFPELISLVRDRVSKIKA